MRTPIFRIVNDDDPMDYVYPCTVTINAFDGLDYYNPQDRILDRISALSVNESVTVGGGAAVQFTIERIR